MKDWETTSSRLCHLTFHQIGALCIPLVLWIINFSLTHYMGLPIWVSGKASPCQAGDSSLIPWVENILWRRKWQVTPVFLLGESRGQRSLGNFRHVGSQKSQTALSDWTATRTTNLLYEKHVSCILFPPPISGFIYDILLYAGDILFLNSLKLWSTISSMIFYSHVCLSWYRRFSMQQKMCSKVRLGQDQP